MPCVLLVIFKMSFLSFAPLVVLSADDDYVQSLQTMHADVLHEPYVVCDVLHDVLDALADAALYLMSAA